MDQFGQVQELVPDEESTVGMGGPEQGQGLGPEQGLGPGLAQGQGLGESVKRGDASTGELSAGEF